MGGGFERKPEGGRGGADRAGGSTTLGLPGKATLVQSLPGQATTPKTTHEASAPQKPEASPVQRTATDGSRSLAQTESLGADSANNNAEHSDTDVTTDEKASRVRARDQIARAFGTPIAAPGEEAGARAQLPRLQLKPTMSIEQPAIHAGQAHPVQRKANGDATDAAAPAEIAGRGVAGAGGTLPHREQIQASFGRHDVSTVQAHQGPAARDAAGALGAEAFAFGNAVAFGSSPDLHTAAHEAAHVVQQRGGVQLKGGIDQPGDHYERHADAVANAVVAGHSAEPLLDQVASSSGATSVVQRRSEPGKLVNAIDYLKLNDRSAADAIMRHVVAITPPMPHPRLAWHNLGAFYKHFFKQLDRILFVFDNPTDLAQLVSPQDPYATIDAVRPLTGKHNGAAVGAWDWQPSVGTALAELIEEALVASLYRLGPRWLQIAELAGDVSGTSVIVNPDAIPRSHPMDRAVAPALCQLGVLEVLADKQHKGKAKPSTKLPAQPAGVGLRPVQYVWLGKENRDLWNWVRATSPADATVEEVSAQLFSDTAESHGEKHGDYLAFAMTSAPPLFGLPGHWAIRFDQGKAYAPATVLASTDASENNLVALAGSGLADEQALREANVAPAAQRTKPDAGASAAVATLAQDALSQATYLKRTLGSWHLAQPVDPTLTFLGRRMGESADASAAKWQPVLAGQKDKLSRIGAGIVEIDRAVVTMGIANKQGDEAKPLRDILRLYADAAGTSHLTQTSEALLQRAAALQATLPLRGVQSATRDLGASADMLRDSTPPGDPERDRLSSSAVRIDEDARKLQSSMMRGDKVDPHEVDRITVDAGEIALKSKVHAIATQLTALENAAHEAGDGFFATLASLFSGDFRGLGFETQVMKDSLESVTRDMDWQAQAAGLGLRVDNAKDLDDYNRERMRIRKEALARAQGQFAKMAANDRIKDFLQKGASLVKWQSFRTSCVKLAVMIGISIVGGALGSLVARGVGGMLMSSSGVAAMEDLSMVAQLTARGYGLVADTAVTSLGQKAVFGGKLGETFFENLLMNLGSVGVLKLIGRQAETLAQVEHASQVLWTRTGVAGKVLPVLKEGAAITGHAIMGAALGYVANRIVATEKQSPPETLEEWLLQGASIAVGRYVGKSMEAHAANAKKLAAIQGFAAGQKLLASTTALHENAVRAEANPQPNEAAELLAKRHEVLSDEIKALDELEKSPELLKASGLHLSDVRQMRTEAQGQLAEVHSRAFAETPLHLAGLEELIPGAQWKGSHEQITAAIESAKRAGVKIVAKPPQGDSDSWHVEVEGRPLELVETKAVGAHAVPGSRFSGIRGKDEPKPTFTERDVTSLTAGATEILNLNEKGFRNVISTGDNRLLITNGSKQIRARVTLGEPMQQVAKHDCKPGAKEVTITISSEANVHDITRATAHEIAEIQALLVDPKAVGPDALVKGSTSDKLSPHDEGRIAELKVLLYELDNEPSMARRAEIKNEVDKLLDHVGLDKQQIVTDERAKKVLGPELTRRVDQLAGKRLKIQRSQIRIKDPDPRNGQWNFSIEADIPGFKEPPMLAQGHLTVDANGMPEGGPDFSIDKRVVLGGSEHRFDIEGIPSLTDFALAEGSKAYEKRFGHPPTELGGSLADDNKAIFQRAYIAQINKGVDPAVAKDIAAAETPFVQARARRGYTKLDARVIATKPILMGIPPQTHTVPVTIHVTMRKSK